MILKPQLSDGPKLNLVKERAECYTQKRGTWQCYWIKTYSVTTTTFKHILWEGVPKDQPPEFRQLKQRLKGEER